jgi:hypothetical protein
MSLLTGKTILILSPQSWGIMLISKHHYAVELAKANNIVYFLNPPNDIKKGKRIIIRPSGIHENLFLVDHRLNFPFVLKFHAIGIFHFFMRGHIRKLLKFIGRPIDLVWSFDIGYVYPFRFFPANAYKIFHPVDEPLVKIAIDSAIGADIIFSVTKEILDKYRHLGIPLYFINHGLADEFLPSENKMNRQVGAIHVGFSGNLLRSDLDKEIIIAIVEQNPHIYFEFWGNYEYEDSKIPIAVLRMQYSFIKTLKSLPNVKLHGPVNAKVLAREFLRMDAFLICYNVQLDQSKGTNYHKIMEFLSTGKIIISNNITTYSNRPDLIQMVGERNSNEQLPALFSEVMKNIEEHNSPEKTYRRIAFARDNVYVKQVKRIEEYLELNF